MGIDNRAFIFQLKSCDRRLKILINEWSEIFNSNCFKSSKETGIEICRQVLPEIFKAKLNNNNVNIEQGQLNFDWFTHHCVVTKGFDWLKDETHISSFNHVRGRLMNISEFRNTLIRVLYAI